MKALPVVTMIFGLWVLLMFGSARATTTVSFDLGSVTKNAYATFICSLRNAAKDATLKYYGIPMLPPTTLTPKYVLTELKAKADAKTITLMYRRNNLYIMGYKDTYNGRCRYHIFSDVTDTDYTDAENTMCPTANNRESENINYASSYPAIEGKAGKSRSQVDIGTDILESSIGKISGKDDYNEQTEAVFLLAAIQMTAEAARFTYIENRMKTHLTLVRPDYKMIRLEKKWDKISTAIHDAKNGIISPPLSLNDTGDEPWIVIRVDEIKPDISLLNYNKGTCQLNKNAILIPTVNYIMSY